MTEAIFNIPFCLVQVWSCDIDGDALELLWGTPCLENVQIRETQVNERSAPSGAVYRVPHTLDESHSITLDGLQDMVFKITRNQTMVIYIAWRQADGGKYTNGIFRARTYFGCLDEVRGIAGSDVNGSGGNRQSRSFSASFYVESNGTGSPTGPANAVNA